MVEILWKTNSHSLPLKEQEFYELRMLDLGTSVRPRLLVREIYVTWSEKLQQIICDGYDDELCWTHEEAQRKYLRRKTVIIKKGFFSSDGQFPLAGPTTENS